jgi:hypothetical protein
VNFFQSHHHLTLFVMPLHACAAVLAEALML